MDILSSLNNSIYFVKNIYEGAVAAPLSIQKADYKSKFKGKVKTIEFYIKPEDKAVYYVINGDFSDKIEL